VGEDGVLLVDTQSEGDAPELKKIVEAFGKGSPRIIINTHRHVEHVGGNALLGEAAIVIAHDLVRSKLRSGSYLFNEFPETTLPDVTLTDSLSVYFNGEKIELLAFPGSHDDNEVIVHFTGSKVVHLSSVVNGFNFPSIDSDGDALMFEKIVAKAIELLPEDVVIVSGHNSPGSWADLHAYRDMLVKTTEVVRAGLAAGKDAEGLKAEHALDEWKAYAGSYVSVDEWIDYLVTALEGKPEGKKTVHEPLYNALKGGDTEAAIALYRALKRDHADEYSFDAVHLVVIGDKLLAKERTQPAIGILELCLEEDPEGTYAYYAHYDLARAHQKLGDTPAAIRHCERALELSPENETVAALLAKLKTGE
jgi:glyoxylase-like metal-dependent hydrolase (beta-lactamase superfamily II)